MSLFQSSVIQKEIQNLNQTVIDEKWNEFIAHFGNVEIQQKIRGLKEEQYQGEFLDDLFVKVLGYTKPPKPNHNLVTEQKNETNSKKADGAIIVDEKVIGVIELKGTNTTDLEKVKEQAFLYKVSHPECIYVITSNFEKLRFYIENTVDYIEFNLFQLTKKEFSLLYICLSYENIKNNVPKHLKDESVSKESQITKQLYKDYSDFKQTLFNNLVELNPQYDKLLLFKKTQKLLDRFLFIFFAEDRQLVPTNLIRRINLEWEKLREMRIPVSLYDRYKTYFEDLNAGATVTLPAFGKKTGDAITAQFEIFAYNGGLFMPDEVLDNVKIDDALLHKHSILLSDYDFESDVDVNILGHIFENSLNEIDEIKSEIEGQVIDKTKTKRKKDGVFYTPKYITKYIVDNTVGKLCTEKKNELKLIEEEYHSEKNLQSKTKKALLDKLTEYRNWLLNITICDPACGSGAFLNQALEFLIAEHRYIDELQAKLMGDSMILSDVEASILENNLFGVDLNDESVEIAKLSLWLRTAQRGRKLTSLNNNIKCGNSLIDDPEVAGDKAFSWEKEFPSVFEKGGFDVIIGNPPYVNVELIPVRDKEFYKTKYESFYKRSDLFCLFVELGAKILTDKGSFSFIIPSIILNNLSYKKIREILLSQGWLSEVCYTGGKVFADATVDTVIITVNKKNNKFINLCNAVDFNNRKYTQVNLNYFKQYQNTISVNSSESNSVFDKLFNEKFVVVGKYFNVFQGVVTGNNNSYIFENKKDVEKLKIEIDLLRPIVLGRDISKWFIKDKSKLILYLDGKTEIERFPNTKVWLEPFKEKLEKRRECLNGVIPWFSLQWPREKSELDKIPKILLQRTRNESLKTRIVATIDEEGVYGMESLIFLTPQTDKISVYYFLAILNSKLINYLFATKFLNLAIKGDYLKKLQFPIQKDDRLEILSKKMLNLHNDLNKISNQTISLLTIKFNLNTASKKLQNWYELEIIDFFKELKKVNVQLSLTEEAEWIIYFTDNKNKAVEIKSQIDQTDKEIDRMVYELYGLTEEEIQIVENS